MATEIYNFTVKRGDSFRQKINVYLDDIPVDITGWTIYFTVKKQKIDTDDKAVIKKNITEHIDPTKGESMLLVLPDETKNLLGSYYYDLQIKRPVSQPGQYDDIQTPLEGIIIFTEDITIRTNNE